MANLTGAHEFAVARARKFLHQLASRSNRTLRSPEIVEIHDLRVGIRRFTQVLLVFKACFPAKEVKRVRRALKKTMALAGAVRDLDVAAGILGKSRLAEAATFRSHFQGRPKEARRILVDKLQRWTRQRIFPKWRRKLSLTSANGRGGPAGAVEDVANEMTPRLVRRFCALGERAAAGTDQMEQLHQLRIAAKKVRYTLELFAPPHESVIQERLRQLKKLQDLLGEIHDLETVRDMVLKEDSGPKLCAELERKRDRKIEEF
jgi:CHAD domain-containing protein